MSTFREDANRARSKVAAVCAPPPNHNPGMQSVDLALLALSRRHPQLDLRLYRLPVVDPDELLGAARYSDLIAHWDDVLSCDRILYWGDFHQMRSYINELDQRRHARRKDVNVPPGDPTSRYLLLDGVDASVRRRAVGFGGTLLHNSSRDYAEHGYREALSALLREGRAWWFRDPYSATQAAALAGVQDRTFLGTDASLLLPPTATEIESLGGQCLTPHGHLGVYLGRGYGSYAQRYRFATKLAALLGRRTTWIPWMPDRGAVRSRRFRVRHPLMVRRGPTEARILADLLAEIAACSGIITDTYHLAVNAWRTGIPAVCIGHDVSPQLLDVSSGPKFEWRDKRHVFYSMYGLQGLYVHERELNSRRLRTARLQQLRSRLRDPEPDVQSFQARVALEREHFEAQLVKALTG